MRRIGVIGALVLILATVGGPAFAQVDPAGGSVLPNPPQSQPLPRAGRSASSSGSTTPRVSTSSLAETGMQVSTGAALGLGLVVAGGGALMLARRRSAA